MTVDNFNQLIESIKQAGEIKKGNMKPGGVFNYDLPDIKLIRQ